jgi:1-acyl-sn-glycerol-3-phosphate acyltransferase
MSSGALNPAAAQAATGWRGAAALGRGAAVTLAILGFGLFGVPLQRIALAANWPLARRIPRFFHRTMCRLLRVEVRFHGSLAPATPLLIVSNHVSWLDILSLSTREPVSFLAKREVRSWPVFGTFAKLQQSIFVARDKTAKLPEVNAEIAARLRAGDRIVLFAESTTSDGTGLLRFRAAHFGAAKAFLSASPEAHCLTIQPVAVSYRALDGRTELAWYGDAQLLPHLWNVIRGGPYVCDVRVADPILFGRSTDRKAVTRETEDAVRGLLLTPAADSP